MCVCIYVLTLRFVSLLAFLLFLTDDRSGDQKGTTTRDTGKRVKVLFAAAAANKMYSSVHVHVHSFVETATYVVHSKTTLKFDSL